MSTEYIFTTSGVWKFVYCVDFEVELYQPNIPTKIEILQELIAYELISPKDFFNSFEHECTCESLDLFRHGCKCGGK